MFANTLVLDGRVVGTWRRRELTRTVDITATPFGTLSKRAQRELESALTSYGGFLGKQARITWSQPSS